MVITAAPRKLPPVPSAILFQSVPLGTSQSTRGAFYAAEDATFAFQISGDAVGVFRLLTVSTFDVVEDPEGPPGHPVLLVLQLAKQVEGAAPIHVKAGRALEVAAEFNCPTDQSQAAFTAAAAGGGR